MDYVKQLEQKNDELQQRVSIAESALNALNIFSRKQSFFQYRLWVQKKDCENFIWEIAMNRNDIFRVLSVFKSTLNEYDKIIIECIRCSRFYFKEDEKHSNDWEHSQAWEINVVKNNKDNWIIEEFEIYNTPNFYGVKYEVLNGKSFSKHLKRWTKNTA